MSNILGDLDKIKRASDLIGDSFTAMVMGEAINEIISLKCRVAFLQGFAEGLKGKTDNEDIGPSGN